MCRESGLTLWQCPNFLFIILGTIVIMSILAGYYISSRYSPDPLVAALFVIMLAGFLMVLSYPILRGFTSLAEANKTKAEFISVASHELRTPLTNIKWSLSLLIKNQDGNLNNAQLEDLRIIKENNQRMIDLVNDLLVVSRLSQGRLPIKPQAMDLKVLVEELLHDYQSYALGNNITLKLESVKDLPKVYADPDKIKMVLQHLIDNGIRYGRGGGWVEIRLTKSSRKKIRCDVEDNGVGIPKTDQSKIFKRKFFRSANVVRYQTQGTGLGLFIVRSIIEGSRGKIDFYSKEDKGSDFWFTLPIS